MTHTHLHSVHHHAGSTHSHPKHIPPRHIRHHHPGSSTIPPHTQGHGEPTTTFEVDDTQNSSPDTPSRPHHGRSPFAHVFGSAAPHHRSSHGTGVGTPSRGASVDPYGSPGHRKHGHAPHGSAGVGTHGGSSPPDPSTGEPPGT